MDNINLKSTADVIILLQLKRHRESYMRVLYSQSQQAYYQFLSLKLNCTDDIYCTFYRSQVQKTTVVLEIMKTHHQAPESSNLCLIVSIIFMIFQAKQLEYVHRCYLLSRHRCISAFHLLLIFDETCFGLAILFKGGGNF